MLRKMIYAMAVCFFAVACVNEQVPEDSSAGADNMKEKEELGLYNNGNDILVYDKEIHQYAFNTKRCTFRIQNAGQNRLMVCVFSEAPVVGRTVEAVITTKGLSNFKDTVIDMEVLKITDGKVWLYDAESKTGLVVMQ